MAVDPKDGTEEQANYIILVFIGIILLPILLFLIWFAFQDKESKYGYRIVTLGAVIVIVGMVMGYLAYQKKLETMDAKYYLLWFIPIYVIIAFVITVYSGNNNVGSFFIILAIILFIIYLFTDFGLEDNKEGEEGEENEEDEEDPISLSPGLLYKVYSYDEEKYLKDNKYSLDVDLYENALTPEWNVYKKNFHDLYGNSGVLNTQEDNVVVVWKGFVRPDEKITGLRVSSDDGAAVFLDDVRVSFDKLPDGYNKDLWDPHSMGTWDGENPEYTTDPSTIYWWYGKAQVEKNIDTPIKIIWFEKTGVAGIIMEYTSDEIVNEDVDMSTLTWKKMKDSFFYYDENDKTT